MSGPPPLPSEADLHLRTHRLDLVPIRREHARDMFELLADPVLYGFTADAPPPDVEALERRYGFWERRRAPDGSELWLNWVMVERAFGETIGHLQAGVGAGRADVAWVVGSRWQGRGYASEAAVRLVGWLPGLGVADVRASIHPEHAASIRVAERAGLERTEELQDGETIWRLVLPGGSG